MCGLSYAGALRQGDRVEPCAELPDYHLLESGKPEVMLFWRTSQETSVRHRNPLFCSALATSLTAAFTIDTMHTWCLGLHQQLVALALWAVVESEIFTTSTSQTSRRSKEDQNKKAMHALGRHLDEWYRQFAVTNPNVVVTRVHDCHFRRSAPHLLHRL